MPEIGTDTSFLPGNEKGYLVGVGECVDYNKFGNKVRLNKGDVVGLTAWYDVDPQSTLYAPAPGGKHGGIMALFFSIMACDPGTWGEVYVCRNDTCVGVPASKGSKLEHYKDFASCSTGCGAPTPTPEPTPPTPRPVPVPTPVPTPVPAGSCTVSKGMNNHGHNMMQKKGITSTEDCCSACVETEGCVGFTFVHRQWLTPGQCWLKDSIDDLVSDSSVDSGVVNRPAERQSIAPESPVGYTYFNWRDCGSDNSGSRLADIADFSPKKMLVGGTNKLEVTANFKEEIAGANFTVKLISGALGATLFDFSGDACQPGDVQKSLVNQMHMTWSGVNCPMTQGTNKIDLELWIDPVIPKDVAYTSTTLLLHTAAGEEILCMEVSTEGKKEKSKSPIPTLIA